MQTTKRIALLTSGGDAPGMNAAVRAATRAALARGWEMHGVRNGYAGLMNDTIEPLQARDVGGIIQRGGTVLGSARSPEFATDAGRAVALANLRRRGIDALIVIGGNGTQTGASVLAHAGFAVVGVASTVDNDLAGTDVTIGVDTAVNITVEAIDRLRTTGSSHKRAFLVETMGRNCGYIALMAGILLVLAGIAESLATPAQQAIFVQIGRRGGMGSLMGLNAMGNAIGFLSGSLVGALVKDLLGIEAVFTFAGVITIGGMGAFVFLMTRESEEIAAVPAPSR